ncbi:MAG: peptidoglycan DD-metalloendopeptidase family protein [Clostridia bacterium]|nr:peptidoglycan DD-metalloendopeptidase family protein [Clostridia bacterium]
MKSNFPLKAAALICCAVIMISFAAAALPLSQRGAEGAAEVPEYDYGPLKAEQNAVIASEATEYACAMYIDGVLAGYYKDVTAAKEELEHQKSLLLEQSGVDYISASFSNNVTFKSGSYAVSQIEAAESRAFPELSAEIRYYETVGYTLDYEVEYRDNAELYYGREKTVSEGRDGYSETTYLVVLSGGKELSRTAVAENIVTEPVNCVIERGVKAKKPSADVTPIFIVPYDGAITSEYGTRYLMGNSFHKGVDISGVKSSSECYGAEIHAGGDGVVIQAGWMDGFGYVVIIEHANGMHSYYAHQKQVACSVGDVVKQGDVIGYIGSSGRSTGPHVHFELRVPDENGKYYAIDPEPYLIDYDSYPHRG